MTADNEELVECPRCNALVRQHRDGRLWSHYVNGDWLDSTDPTRGTVCSPRTTPSKEGPCTTTTKQQEDS